MIISGLITVYLLDELRAREEEASEQEDEEFA
jgi:hypothetical protein